MNKPPKPIKKPNEDDIQMADNGDTWFDAKSGRFFPLSKMPMWRLKRAKHIAQRMELQHFNKANFFGEMVEKLDAEATRRGIQMKDLNTEYHKNTQVLKDAIQKIEGNEKAT